MTADEQARGQARVASSTARDAGDAARWPTPTVDLSVVSWNHRRAPLTVLEQVAVPQPQRAGLLAVLRDAGFPEAVLLSTCSRTEIYTRSAAAPRELLALVAQHRRCPADVLAASADHCTGPAAVEHLFRVTAGLESRIVGEPEVCGQVRRAVRDARRAGTLHTVLTPAFSAAVRCAQRVRDVAGLGTARRSWGARAVDVGLHALDRVPVGARARPGALVIGAGRMGADVVEELARRGLRPVVLARDEVAARRLAGAAQVCPLSALVDALRLADLVYCATSADHDLVTADHVREAMTGQSRSLTVVDLSVPRNVHVAVADLPGVRLLGPADLGDDARTDARLASSVDTGSALVRVETERYVTAIAARRAGPLIAAMRRHVEDLCLRELQRTAPPGAQSEDLARAAHLVAVRLLHQPTLSARAAAAAGDVAALRMLADAFGMPCPMSVLVPDARGGEPDLPPPEGAP